MGVSQRVWTSRADVCELGVGRYRWSVRAIAVGAGQGERGDSLTVMNAAQQT